MSEFDETRARYNQAQGAKQQAQTEVIRTREEVKRLRREAEQLARVANQGAGDGAAARLEAIQGQLRAASVRLQEQTVALSKANIFERDALKEYAVFTNPVEAVSLLPDDTPMALFPLRLETRFKTVPGNGAPQQEMWVRVFPDDILVDTFQPEISETELANVILFWTNWWRAGGDTNGRRAAWAALVRSHGAGRAWWLIEQYAPSNPEDEPVAGPNEHILMIRPLTPVPDGEKELIATFWSRVWLSGGSDRDAAYADLETDLGPSRAATVEAELVPVNLYDVAIKPDDTLIPVVVFLDLPVPATLPVSAEDWTRGATTWLLPERLVLLGFRDGEQVLQEVGSSIPATLQVGPDPAADESEQIQADGEEIVYPESLQWMVDFEAAVAQGMGFRVNLTQRDIVPKFDRLFVLGVRLHSDATEGRDELGKLISHHQANRNGFEILPQGRATNNTDADSSAYSWWVDPDESYTHFFETDPTDDPGHWRTRKDGAWLAGLLGVDPAILRASPNYHGTDQAEARAMNIALWPATLGYYMEQMMEPVFSEETVYHTRDFFNRFVIGRGTLPLVRVGRQPYGILPATVWSQMAWWRRDGHDDRIALNQGTSFYERLFALLEQGVSLWTNLASDAAHVGDPGDDPQQTLLDIVGLHPTSAEFYQRYSQSFTQYYNTLGFALEPVSEPLTAAAMRWITAGLVALSELGWQMPPDGELPELLEKIFLKDASLLKGFLVEAELSETQTLSVSRADGLNYIAWLQSAARTSHDTLRKQEGFTDGVPSALLYSMLRHALDLGFIDTGLQLRREALDWSDATYLAERKEPKFLYIDDAAPASQSASRWESLYRAEPAVTGDNVLHLGDYISSILVQQNPYFNEQLNALDVLKNASTAALERAFVEHIDCLSYRLDAWRLGLQSAQLGYMRGESDEGFSRDGIYIGAYGWLEDVSPAPDTVSPVQLDDELAAIFAPQDQPELMHDSANYGHIHAPSLDQAVTAAILRNGHLANATPDEPDLLAVDLSSERVRLATYTIEGIRASQSLGALLGYQLERALHDEPDLFLDRLIYDLRQAFPLAGNRIRRTRETAEPAMDSITQVEARNVVDGEAFMNHIAETGVTSYPYGLSNLPPLSEFSGPGLPSSAEIGALIDGHVAKIRSIGDAVGDLAVAEGVFQVVRGNYERAGAALDAFGKGTHPPEPQVVETPRSGKTLTHRVGLHLEGGLLPGDPINTRPRAKGEPAIAQWLAGQMPATNTIFARVTWRDEATATDHSLTPSMTDLGLAPVDLFYLVDAGGARDMPGFDDLLIDYATVNGVPSPSDNAIFMLEYKPEGAAGLTLFELAPLIRALRGVLLGARPLRPTDLALQNEASRSEDVGLIVRADKASAVLAELQATLPAVDALVTALDVATAEGIDPEVARDAARDNIDQWILEYADCVRPLLPFGLQAASLTTATEGRRAPFAAMLKALDELIASWQTKQTDYDDVMAEYAALPVAATDEERQALLIRAGRIVSTKVIAPLPPIATLETDVPALRALLDTELGNLQALRDGAVRVGATLSDITAFLPIIALIEHATLDLAPFRDSVFALVQSLQQKASFLSEDINRRITTATDAIANASTLVDDKAQTAVEEAAHALLGEAFMVLPEFVLSIERLSEWENAWANRADLLTHLMTGPDATPYPVEDWLHGLARVRERMRWLEQVDLLGNALGAAGEVTLEALQFPHRPHDVWLGLKFPETFANGDPFELDEDKLLYSAHFGAGAQIDSAVVSKTYTGLMLDEWVEVIPADIVTSGLAFHYNRPNSEAPQAVLLVTPPAFRGQWRWDDLVATLHETLDFAQLRTVEPADLDRTALGTLLPAVLSAVTVYPITAMLNFSFNNQVYIALQNED